jgi:hypothetical protein
MAAHEGQFQINVFPGKPLRICLSADSASPQEFDLLDADGNSVLVGAMTLQNRGHGEILSRTIRPATAHLTVRLTARGKPSRILEQVMPLEAPGAVTTRAWVATTEDSQGNQYNDSVLTIVSINK